MFINLKRTIEAGVSNLPAMKEKIMDFCAGGFISTDEMNTLLVLAEQKASGLGLSEIPAQMESVLKRLDAIEARLAELTPDVSENGEGNSGLKDPSTLPVYVDGTNAPDGSVWIVDGAVYKSIAGDYGLAWGPAILPQFWQNVSDEYDLSKLNV